MVSGRTSGGVTVQIRAVREGDLPALLDLYRQLSGPESPQLSVADARAMLRKIGAYPNYTVYVATLDEAIVGTYALLIMDNIGNGGRPSGIVEDVVVDAEYRGQGIGQVMMDHARDLCRAAGCYKLTLSSNLRREAAHRFYESLGYEKHGYSFRLDLPDAAGDG